jgi:hypothetical protein
LQIVQHPHDHVRLVDVSVALILGRHRLAAQVGVALERVGRRVKEKAVGFGDRYPHLELGRLAHLAQLFLVFLVELAHPVRVAGDAADG